MYYLLCDVRDVRDVLPLSTISLALSLLSRFISMESSLSPSPSQSQLKKRAIGGETFINFKIGEKQALSR